MKFSNFGNNRNRFNLKNSDINLQQSLSRTIFRKSNNNQVEINCNTSNRKFSKRIVRCEKERKIIQRIIKRLRWNLISVQVRSSNVSTSLTKTPFCFSSAFVPPLTTSVTIIIPLPRCTTLFPLCFFLFFLFPIRAHTSLSFRPFFYLFSVPERTSITEQAALLTHVNHKLWFLQVWEKASSRHSWKLFPTGRR